MHADHAPWTARFRPTCTVELRQLRYFLAVAEEGRFSRAGLDLERARAAVHRLLHTAPKNLHEVPDTSPTDLGPLYELAPRT